MLLDLEKIKELYIVKYPQRVLRERTRLVERFDEGLWQLVLKMIEKMHESKGVGLAANQVGVPLRIFVANHSGEAGQDMVFINGEIVDAEGWTEAEEGCLSVPQIYTKIRRHQRAVIRAVDVKGKAFEMEGTELLARVLQHETDHLDGKLIIDRMSLAAKMANRRQIKYLEELAKE